MNSITNNQQIINIIPQRIASDHYQIQSFTDTGKIYDLTFNYEEKHWECSCPDATIRHTASCKHLILLRAFIKAEKDKAAQAPVQHSSSVELVQTLERIVHLENAQRDNVDHFENIDYYLNIKEDQVAMLQDKLGGYEYQIAQQQKQIDRQADLISTLQTSVCKLNELIIKQDMQIQKLAAAHDEACHSIQEMVLQRAVSDRLYEDQAQQIDKLTELVSSQQRPSEQIVKIVVEQPARQTREVSTKEEIIRIGNECKYGKSTVKVLGNCAASCDCSTGAKGQQCRHMIEVDKFLSK